MSNNESESLTFPRVPKCLGSGDRVHERVLENRVHSRNECVKDVLFFGFGLFIGEGLGP